MSPPSYRSDASRHWMSSGMYDNAVYQRQQQTESSINKLEQISHRAFVGNQQVPNGQWAWTHMTLFSSLNIFYFVFFLVFFFSV